MTDRIPLCPECDRPMALEDMRPVADGGSICTYRCEPCAHTHAQWQPDRPTVAMRRPWEKAS